MYSHKGGCDQCELYGACEMPLSNTIKPLVDEYFACVKNVLDDKKVLLKGETVKEL